MIVAANGLWDLKQSMTVQPLNCDYPSVCVVMRYGIGGGGGGRIGLEVKGNVRILLYFYSADLKLCLNTDGKCIVIFFISS